MPEDAPQRTVEAAREAMREANEAVTDMRNAGDGKPTLAAIDRLTDAVDAYLATLRRDIATTAPIDGPSDMARAVEAVRECVAKSEAEARARREREVAERPIVRPLQMPSVEALKAQFARKV